MSAYSAAIGPDRIGDSGHVHGGEGEGSEANPDLHGGVDGEL